MGHWGVKSYENDDADAAIDAGLEHVHGAAYEAAMDDRNPMTFDQAQQSLASPATFAAAIDALRESVGLDKPENDWDDVERLAFVGVVVRHAEFGVPIPAESLDQAIAWLETESIDWDEPTLRNLRRQKEITLLKRLRTAR
jgi:hypothetical protein